MIPLTLYKLTELKNGIEAMRNWRKGKKKSYYFMATEFLGMMKMSGMDNAMLI